MGKHVQKHGGASLEPEVSDYLRELAGWPIKEHHRGGYRARSSHVVIHRDETGRIIGSTEHIDTDEYEEYSEAWGK